MSTTRKPAITRTIGHPADTIPDRSAAMVHDPAPVPAHRPLERRTAEERLTEQHNVRIRPSVKDRLGKAVDKLRYETGDRSISIASIQSASPLSRTKPSTPTCANAAASTASYASSPKSPYYSDDSTAASWFDHALGSLVAILVLEKAVDGLRCHLELSSDP